MTEHEILAVLEEADINGFAGACGEAAKAINRAFFDGEGKLAFAINKHVQGDETPFIGHVACLSPDGTLWDARGKLTESDLRGWGMIGPEDPDYDLSEEEAHDAEIVYMDPDEERWTRTLYPPPGESESQKLMDLHTAEDILNQQES